MTAGSATAAPAFRENNPMRYLALILSLVAAVVSGALALAGHGWALWIFAPAAILSAIGLNDMRQTKHSLRRNYPVLANIRNKHRRGMAF